MGTSSDQPSRTLTGQDAILNRLATQAGAVDYVESPQQKPVDWEAVNRIATSVGAKDYTELSPRTQKPVDWDAVNRLANAAGAKDYDPRGAEEAPPGGISTGVPQELEPPRQLFVGPPKPIVLTNVQRQFAPPAPGITTRLPFRLTESTPVAPFGPGQYVPAPEAASNGTGSTEAYTKLYEEAVPRPAPQASGFERFSWGAGRALSGMMSPEAVAEVLALGALGKAVPALANAPVIAERLKNVPAVLKALDQISAGAVPGGAAAYGIHGLVKQGVPQNAEEAGEASVNALMAGLGVYGAVRAGLAVGKAHAPEAPTTRRQQARPLAPEATSGIETVNPVEAAARAEELEARGQNLAGQSWRTANVKEPTEVNTDVGKVYLQPFDATEARPYHQVLDADGNLVVGGTAKTVGDWLDAHAKPVPTPETFAAVGTPTTTKIVPPAATPGLPATAIAGEAGPVTGTVYNTPEGAVTVKDVKRGQVYFGKEGSPRTFKMPVAQFQTDVIDKHDEQEAPPAATETPQAPAAPEQQPANEEVIPQPPTVTPAAPEPSAAVPEVEAPPVSTEASTPEPPKTEEVAGPATSVVVPPESETPATGARALADAVYKKLSDGESLGDVTQLNKLAEQHFGASRTSGVWTPKDAFDAMEAGVNKYLADKAPDLMSIDAIDGLKHLRDLMSRLTTQGTRTDEQVANQQFSTPPTEAYVVAKVAGLRPDDVVLEPSAGNGGLAVWPKAIGAKVYTNEISPRRRDMLDHAGLGPATAHDGELINALLDTSITPSVVLMNPPFSASTTKSNAAKNNNTYGFNHVQSALQRLADGGRLVVILGGGQANEPQGGASFEGKKSGDWFRRIGERYNIRANVRVNGKEYSKYGTSFATRIIVIDKDGPTDWGKVVRKNADTLEEAYESLRDVANSRPATVSPGAGSEESTGESEPGTGVDATGQPGEPGVRGAPEGKPETGRPHELADEPAGAPGGHGPVQPGPGSEPVPLREPDVRPGEHNEPESAAVPPGDTAHENEQRPVGEPAGDRLQLEQRDAAEDKAEQEDSEAYVTYKPTLQGAPHPGAIVETKTMATVQLPDITYRPALPPEVLTSGALSGVQLEAIALAGQQNSKILPGGFRGSVLIGDGTGVGKGRISAGIIWDNWRQGRKRLVWVSEKWDLMQAAAADFEGIGADDLLRGVTKLPSGEYRFGSDSAFKGLNKWNGDAKISHEGVIFTTYALIRSESKKGQTRANQLQQWLAGKDDGDGAYILFDEAHNLKNAVPARGAPASKTGTDVKNLMAAIPGLRSASLSATAATEVNNLGYLDRLGLWGPGTSFPGGFMEFQTQIGSGRMAAMELVARELKATGRYIARTLSFKGVTYDHAEHEVTPEQKALYRTAARAWRTVLDAAEATVRDITNGGAPQRGRFLSAFYGAQLRFFGILVTTLKIPTAVRLAEEALAIGKSVVITLVNTNEAAQNREKNRDRAAADDGEEESGDLDFGPKEMLVHLVRENYPTQQFNDDVDENGRPIKVAVTYIDSEGKIRPVQNPTAVKERDDLIAKINRDLHMPRNPLDILIDALGGKSKVAELTGRKEVYDEASGKFIGRGDPGTARKDINIQEMSKFQDGKKRVAILSSAAGTGISLHASHAAKNQQKRLHITLQVGWSADRQMQMFGRTHRTNQAHAPEYVLLASDLGGEKRFLSTIARRLGSLGALTKGQKNATTGSSVMEKVNFETEQGKKATVAFYNALLRDNIVPGTRLTGRQILDALSVLKTDPRTGEETVPENERSNITRTLNRLLALDPDIQNAVYNYFYDLFEATVQQAIEDGTLDTGVKTLPGDEFNVKEERLVSTEPKTGAKTFYYPVDAKYRLERVSPKELDKRLAAHASTGARITRNDKTGKLSLVYDAVPIVSADGTTRPALRVSKPGNGRWMKAPADEVLRDNTNVDTWAAEQLHAAETKLKQAEGSLKYAQADYDRSVAGERERRTNAAQAKVNGALASVRHYEVQPQFADRLPEMRDQFAAAEEELKTAQTWDRSPYAWQKDAIEQRQKTVDEAKAKVDEVRPIHADPDTWAKEQWEEQYNASPSHATDEYHLIGGAVLRYWNAIKEANPLLNIYTTVDSKTGQRIVGVDVPAAGVNRLLARITGGNATVTARQLANDVLMNGTNFTLEGGVRIRQGRVARTPVIQVQASDPRVLSNLVSMGVLSERGVTPIHYVPNGASRTDVLDRILAQYPVVPEIGDFSLGMKGPKDTFDNPNTLAEARGEYRDIEGRPVILLNSQGFRAVLEAMGVPVALAESVKGLALNPKGTAALGFAITDISHMAVTDAEHDSAAAMAKAALSALTHSKAENGVILVLADLNLHTEKHIQTTLQEELNHLEQRDLGAPHLDYAKFMASPIAVHAAKMLEHIGYNFAGNDRVAVLEVSVRLMEEPERWRDELGLSDGEARELGTLYTKLLLQQHGTRANALIEKVSRAVGAVAGSGRTADGQVPDESSGNGTPSDSGPGILRWGPASLRRGMAPDHASAKEKVKEFIRTLADFGKSPDEDPGKRHHSRWDAFRRFVLPGRNLQEVREANREVYAAAVKAGASRSVAAALIHNALPEIQKLLKKSGTGISVHDLFAAYQESRLRAIADRYRRWSDTVFDMSDQQIKEALNQTFGRGQSTLMQFIRELDEDHLNLDLAQSALTAAAAGDWQGVRDIADEVFSAAADSVVHTMTDVEYDKVASAIRDNPDVKAADRLYGETIEREIEKSHAEHNGVFAEDLGGLGRYIPLMVPDKANRNMAGRSLPYKAPPNINNKMAMGMSKRGYSTDLAEFAKHLASSLRASGVHNLLKTIREEGWSAPEPKDWDGKFLGPDGIVYKGVKVGTANGRLVMNGDDSFHTRPSYMIMPLFLHEGLGRVMSPTPENPEDLVAAARFLNGISTRGPNELIFHSHGMMGTLYGNTPWVAGDKAIQKALSAPVLKWFRIRFGLANTKPTTPENAKKLVRIAKVGALPAKSHSITYSKEIAEQTGAKRELFSFAPMLYGPNGVDARLRIMMYDLAMEYDPNMSDTDLGEFINQLGNYTPEFQGTLERFVKRVGLGTFATAGMTRELNGLHAALGNGPIPKKMSPVVHWARQFLFGLFAATALYLFAYKAMTGKWPSDDDRFKAGKVPVGDGDGWIDQFRHSKLGDLYWGDGPEVGYINIAPFIAPLIQRILPKSAIDRQMLGGSPEQVVNGIETDIGNMILQPTTGPLTHSAFALLSGREPYLTDMTDREGTGGPQFLPAYSSRLKPGFLGGFAPVLSGEPETNHPGGAARWGAHLAAAAGDLNSASKLAGEQTGLMGADSKRGAGLFRWVIDLAMPGVMSGSSNPQARQRFLMRQKRALQ